MGLDINALRKRLGQLTRSNNRSDILWKPTEGDTTIRIVPLASDPMNPFVEMYFHYLGGKTQLSPLTFGEADPIAEFCEKLRMGGGLSKDEWRETKNFEPKPRTFVPIIVRGQEDKGVRFWGFGKTTFTELLSLIDDDDYGDITHPLNGRDIKVKFVPKEKSPTGFPQTSILASPKQTPISTDKDFAMKVLKEQPDIYEAYPKTSYEELETFLNSFLAPTTGADSSDDEWATATGTAPSESPTASKTEVTDFESEFEDMFNQ